MKNTVIRSRLNPKLEVSLISGHFATRHSIDAIIGRIYPIFGAILLFSAVGVFVGIFVMDFPLLWEIVSSGRGDFAACGRRVTFPAMGKSPKDRRGTAQDERSALIFAFPPVPLYGGRAPDR